MTLGAYKATYKGLIRQFWTYDEKENTAWEFHPSYLQAPVFSIK